MIGGKPVKTMISDEATPCPLDQVNRQFYARASNMLWVSYVTYIATWSGFVYVTLVIEVYARNRGLAGEQDGACQLRTRRPGAGDP